MKKATLTLTLILGSLTVVGCGGSKVYTANLEDQLAERDQELAAARESLTDTEVRLAAERDAKERAMAEARAMANAPKEVTRDLFPPAEPGECYTRVFVPPVYRTNEERIMVKEASFSIQTLPAEHEMAEETVMVKQASTRLEQIPAVFETVTEKILIEDEKVVWKAGRGPIEKIDGNTGEIMCRVVVPARYETRTKRVTKTPATTREIAIPAEYKTVKVRRLVTPAREIRTDIPAEYKTVSNSTLVKDGHMAWREILCETNLTASTVQDIQRALLKAGHDPGPIDGIVGSRTMSAVNSYQRAKNLAVGGLTIVTLKSLGVNV